jgi:hypothetical protein
VWIEPVIAQEMMILRAGTVLSFYGARLADAERHQRMERKQRSQGNPR